MANSIIFITGASGFVGSQVVLDALKAGHRLRINVRREAQIQQLSTRFSPAATAPSQLEFVVNPDLSDSDAIRKSLDDVDYIFHIASPMPGSGEDFKTDYLRPAVKSTEAILEAADLTPSVKRVVITSSLLALMPLGSLDIPGFVVKGKFSQSHLPFLSPLPCIDLPPFFLLEFKTSLRAFQRQSVTKLIHKNRRRKSRHPDKPRRPFPIWTRRQRPEVLGLQDPRPPSNHRVDDLA